MHPTPFIHDGETQSIDAFSTYLRSFCGVVCPFELWLLHDLVLRLEHGTRVD